MLQLSMPPPIWSEYWPLSSCGMPQANSTISMPRMTSPLASENTLPCSRVMSSASSSWCWSSSALKLNRMRARLSAGVSDQAGNAALAAATASATSSVEASGMDEQISPVAGLKPSA
ncbi:hypothetical protein D3C73_1298920 [compost metagenome]